MLREFLITLYLLFFKSVFTFFKLFKSQEKTVFVATFKEDILLLYNELGQQKPSHKRIILQEKKVFERADCKANLLNFRPIHITHFLRSIYHLATASHIILDNYYGFLAVTKFKKNVNRVQIWHANGAFKKFGLEDLSNQHRSPNAIKRFKKVYSNFTHIIVGSEKMKNIFIKSFGTSKAMFLNTGMPRTDFYFSNIKRDAAKKRLFNYYDIIEEKRVLLYAPTYRDNELNNTVIKLDIEKLRSSLADDYILLLRLHPAIENRLKLNTNNEFIINVSGYPDLKDVLVSTDILISDYSSIPFEYSLLKKPMLFYLYDLDTYKASRGLIDNFKDELPGSIVYDENELIKIIKQNKFDLSYLNDFNASWNEYTNGSATKEIIKALYK